MDLFWLFFDFFGVLGALLGYNYEKREAQSQVKVVSSFTERDERADEKDSVKKKTGPKKKPRAQGGGEDDPTRPSAFPRTSPL